MQQGHRQRFHVKRESFCESGKLVPGVFPFIAIHVPESFNKWPVALTKSFSDAKARLAITSKRAATFSTRE
jgi:hypothetical protein